MLLRIDPESAVGLAQQVAGQVRMAIATGELEPGEKLAPARQLAAGLGVNMHTVLRAYSQLRDEGLIELRRGRGAQVRHDVAPGGVDVLQLVIALVRAADQHGVSRDVLISHIQKVRT